MLSRTRLWEQRIADLKEAHDREVAALKLNISALAEQIDYLRMTGGMRPLPAVASAAPKPPMAMPDYMTEEEEDVRAMHDNGLLDAQELEAALADLGISTS